MIDLLITNAHVVTMDAARTVHPSADIAVTEGTIRHVGATAGDEHEPAGRVIDAAGGIVVPGFVNAHTHLAMTMFRGLADDLDLDGFLGRLLPAERTVLSPATVAAGTSLAVAECLRAGITTAMDMYFFPEAAAAAAADSGLRLLTGPVFVEFAGPDDRPFPQRLDWAREYVNDTPAGARWVCPHSTYLLSEEQLRAIGELAASTGARVHVHAGETKAELTQVAARHGGRTPIEVLHDTGLLGARTLLAHGVHLSAGDIDLIRSTGASVTHCPASNLKLCSGFAPVTALRAAGVTVALGTDGAASANDLDPWMAMRLAGYVQAGLHGAGALTADDVLAMATIDGARALGVADRTGSIEVGKQADLVMLDRAAPSLTPSYDPVSTVAYAACRADVRWVLAGGKVAVDDRVVRTVDVDAAIDAVRDLAPHILAAAGGRS
ncbi:MAG: amidohydrolase family protein [Ilumatobacteraceae bacterium]